MSEPVDQYGGPVHIVKGLFVDGTTGQDSSKCGTALAPCRTIQAAVDRVPMVFQRDTRIIIAPGTYDGGIMIVGRISPRMAALTLAGEPGQVVITGPAGVEHGIAIIHSYHVVLQNLRIEGFTGTGVKILDSLDTELRSVEIDGGQDGVLLGESRTTIVGGSVQNSLRHGINCEGGWVVVAPSADPVLIGNNLTSGLWVDLCHVSIQGPVTVWGSQRAMLAMNAGEIDLNMRGDVTISMDAGQEGLTADHHGMIAGYANSCMGDCTCISNNHGVCMAGPATTGGKKTRPTIYDRNN
jgi:hypothetical protein